MVKKVKLRAEAHGGSKYIVIDGQPYVGEKMSFEEWLKKHELSYKDDCLHLRGSLKFVSVRALGEWAWKEVLTLNKKDFGKGSFDKFYKGRHYDFYFIHKNIAVACLGRKEVEKRLKKAGGK